MPSRVCEHCGSDTYKSENFDRVRDRVSALESRWQGAARDNGLLRAMLDVANAEGEEARSGLQRKVARQARVIRRLEQRIRDLGKAPHEGVRPDETAPVQQGGG